MSPRRVVQAGPQARSTLTETARTAGTAEATTTPEMLRNRRTVRSAELVAAVRDLDTTTDPQAFQRIMEWIREEYASRMGGNLIGIFGPCFLGPPYVDHRFDVSGTCIVEHFERSQEPPPPFGAARPLARNGAYAYVEVYDDGTLVPIRADGQPVL